ncbi:MAG TPA: PQQ-binding-like beta-propeller repeat protein [Longimicrobium sp.]|nr:PQQ-binding-like beta-propeller repeat protein [Longimicrobium sp.]
MPIPRPRSAFRTSLLCCAAFALAGCDALASLFAPGETDEPEWQSRGSVRTRWLVPIPGALPGQLQPGPLAIAEGVMVPTGDGRLLALDPATGRQRWITRVAASAIQGARLEYRDGLVVAALYDGAAAVGAADGQVRWTYRAPEDVRVSALNGSPGDRGYPASAYVGVDAGAAYLPVWGGTVSAIDLASGGERWVWHEGILFPNPAGATAAAVSGDTVYVHAWYRRDRWLVPTDLYLFAVDRATGRTVWSRKLPGEGMGPAPFAPVLPWQDLLIVPQLESVLAFRRATGEPAWSSARGTSVRFAALAAGTVFVHEVGGAAAEGMVTALDARTGAVRWSRGIYFHSRNELAVSERRVYATDDVFVNVVDAASGRLLARVRPPRDGPEWSVASAASVRDGAVYVRLSRGGPGRYEDAVWSFAEP